MFEELQLIVLDGRYFKDKFTERNPDESYPDQGRYVPELNSSRSMLGVLTLDAAVLGCSFCVSLYVPAGYCTLSCSVCFSQSFSQLFVPVGLL